MDDSDKNVVRMQSKYSQHCKSCSKLISLNEKITFLCSKCKNYFCEECAMFLNENSEDGIFNCPGGELDPHSAIIVKVTRNVKEYLPMGVSIDELERKKSSDQKKSTIKIIDPNPKNSNKKPSLKILDD